ncbi:sigma-70 family RNA polymerase sigma factor [soil metagenome]
MLSNPEIVNRNSSAEDSVKPVAFSDEMLWENFKKGNELALSMIYKNHVQRLYNYGMHTSRDHDLVTDCIQELFFKLWSKRATVSSVKSVKPYLFMSFRRLLIHQIISKRRFSIPFTDKTAVFEFVPSFEHTLIEDELKAEQIKRLKKCIQSLTKRQREVIYLKFFNELSYQEISEITEMQVDSVYNLVSKAIDLLRKKLQISKSSYSLPLESMISHGLGNS